MEDITAPVPVSIEYSSPIIDPSSGDVVIGVTAQITDDLSGLSSGYAFIEGPSGQLAGWGIGGYNLSVGDDLNGVYETSIDVDQYPENGIWTITELQLYDETGNF